MKPMLLLLCVLACARANAQANNGSLSPYFDPDNEPIAVRTDSTLQLLVSEYVLAKSVKARLGRGCQVFSISKPPANEAGESLLIEGLFLFKNRQRFSLWVPLRPDAEGRFYYASHQALVCSAPGCNNCSILNGQCVGCCSSANGYGIALPNPFVKVLTLFDE